MKYVLTDQQRKLVEENELLIYSFLHKNHLDISEYYGCAAEGLCQAAYKYDPSKGFTFATFAYVVMRNQFLHDMRDEKKWRRFGFTSLDAPVYESRDGNQMFLEPSESGFEDAVEDSMVLCKALENVKFTDKEKFVLREHLQGVTQKKTSETIGLSQAQVSRIVIKCRRKLVAAAG